MMQQMCTSTRILYITLVLSPVGGGPTEKKYLDYIPIYGGKGGRNKKRDQKTT